MIYRFFRNASFNIFADFSNRISNAIIIILISRYLSVSHFGSFNLAATYLTFGMLFSFWGYGNLLTREVAKKPDTYNIFFFNFFVMRFFFSIIAFFIIITIARLLNYSYETWSVIVIFSIGILAESIKNLAFSAFNAFEETYYVSIIFFLSSITKLSISYYLLRQDYGIYELAWNNTIINYLGAVGMMILVFKFLPPLKINFNWKFSLEQTQMAIPLFLIAVLSIAESRLDVLILSGFFSESVVGLYSSALVLQSGLLILPDGIRNAIYPLLARNSFADPRNAGRIYIVLFKYLTLTSLAITAGSLVLAPKLILIIFGKNYADSINIFRIVMLSYPLYSMVILNIRFLNAYNKDSYVVKYFGIDMLITIVLSLWFMPIYGGLGAAFLKVLTTGLLYFLFLFQVYRLLPNIRIRGIFIRGLVSSILMGAVLITMKDINLIVSIMVGFGIYTVSLLILRTFGQEEIKIVKSLLAQRTFGR